MHKLIQIACFSRHISSNHERMFENVFDWEHLPHLHSQTFTSINLLARSLKTLKFEVGLWPAILGFRQTIQMRVCKRRHTWIVRVLSGFMQGLVIRSLVSPENSEGFEVRVDFYVPRSRWYYAPFGPMLKLSYLRLYQEDIAMMTSRQRYLDQRRKTPTKSSENQIHLGKEKEIDCPHFFKFQGNSYLLNMVNGKWTAYTAYCPHLQRSFIDLGITNGTIRCPWHGYEFDLKTGVSKESTCRLPPAPNVIRKGEDLFAVASYKNQKGVTNLDHKYLEQSPERVRCSLACRGGLFGNTSLEERGSGKVFEPSSPKVTKTGS